MIRVLVEMDGGAAASRIPVADGEAHHLRVRRAEEGESVEVRDGAGLVGVGRLIRSGKSWEVEMREATRDLPPAELILAVGAGDRERFAWLVEKATEIGVTWVIPLNTERTAGVGSRLRTEHLDRLRRRSLEAVKQSGAAWAARVEEPLSLVELIARLPAGERWVADRGGPAPPETLAPSPLAVAVGPEGGLTSGELTLLRGAGFLPVRLAPHTLRFETAALAAAAAAAAARLRSHGGSHE